MGTLGAARRSLARRRGLFRQDRQSSRYDEFVLDRFDSRDSSHDLARTDLFGFVANLSGESDGSAPGFDVDVTRASETCRPQRPGDGFGEPLSFTAGTYDRRWIDTDDQLVFDRTNSRDGPGDLADSGFFRLVRDQPNEANGSCLGPDAHVMATLEAGLPERAGDVFGKPLVGRGLNELRIVVAHELVLDDLDTFHIARDAFR